jgi:uncharacterized protein YdaU (DUF1376 family)
MDLMDPVDKYLAITKYLSIGSIRSIFFLMLIKIKMDLMDPMDKYLAITKYLSIGSIGSIFLLILIKKKNGSDGSNG